MLYTNRHFFEGYTQFGHISFNSIVTSNIANRTYHLLLHVYLI